MAEDFKVNYKVLAIIEDGITGKFNNKHEA